ncbi:hypothetical protein [Marinobacter sp. CHS3-4]|uniref:hypothetical protein n=1 Tax=Marinobacter sp. CHS3-4 TaxID=3045174 RepID=UPI0024B5BA1F|nr:hypothetical protein [Marinobacter sp. CHS3-4]MDI9244281.1 hypothetical protein [Marinobacter sp. CHS3-4]
MSAIIRLVLGLTLAATCLARAGEAATSDKLQMLVIHSYGPDSIWVQGIEEGLAETLPVGLEVHYAYLNTKRLPAAHHAEAAERVWEDFQAQQPDLVLICDDNAMHLLGERVSEHVPTVFCGVNGGLRDDYPWALDGRAVTGVIERPVIRRAAFMISKTLDLNARNALILLGSSTTARAFLKHDMGGERKSLIWENLRAEVRVVDNLASFQDEVRSSKDAGFDFLLVAGHQALRDQSGRAMSLDEVNEWISRHSPLPAFTVHLNSIGKNRLIGGLTLLGSMMGRETGNQISALIEQDMDTRKVPIIHYDHGQLVVSKHELERHGLSIRDSFSDHVVFVE